MEHVEKKQHPTQGGVAAIAIQLVTNPRTTSIALLIILNLILLGFGFWWGAYALQAFGAVVSLALALAFLNEKCFKFGAIFTTMFWLVPPVCGAIAVRAYRCMRNCDGMRRTRRRRLACSSCPDVDVGAFSWNVDVPWYLGFLDFAVQWVVDIVNAIPEGICWLNMALGFFFLVLSILYWDWGEVAGTVGGGVAGCCRACCGGGARVDPQYERVEDDYYASAATAAPAQRPLIALPDVPEKRDAKESEPC